MSTCVHFSTFSGIIFTVGTRCRLRFAATFLFWTYCISQGMVRVCPFANLLIGPWLEFDPSAIEQFWLHAERFTDAWAMTYFCTATCSLLAIYRLLEASFQQYFCWVADFIFQPVVMQVCGELQRSSVVHVLHFWFFAYGNYHFFRTLQPGSEILPWRQTEKEPGINSISCQPTDSGSIATVGLYRTISWFDFRSTCWQFLRHNSARFLAQLQLRYVEFLCQCWVTSQVLFPPFRLLLTVLWPKLSTWTVFFVIVTLRYNNWSDSAPAYSPGCVYAS